MVDGGNCHQKKPTSRKVPIKQGYHLSLLQSGILVTLIKRLIRYGKMPEMFPGRVGAVVQETYCETVFQECRFADCPFMLLFVHSN